MNRGDRRLNLVRPSLKLRPKAEAMERRELLTVSPDMFASADQLNQANAIINNFAATVAGGQVAASDTGSTPMLTGTSQGTVTTPGSPFLVAMSPYQGDTPTAAELANEKYTAVFSGTYTTAEPRFTDQASQTYIKAVGTTTDELHGDIQLSIIVPIPGVPTSTNPAPDVEGVAVNLDKSTGSGGFLSFDVFGDPSTSLNSAGLPSHLSFSYSPYSGAGSFTGGLYSLSEGAGTVTIYYKPSHKKLPAGVMSQGTVTVAIQGLVYKTGVTSSFATANLEQSHSVVKPFGKNLPKVNHTNATSPILATRKK
jgi:hypothetical protein